MTTWPQITAAIVAAQTDRAVGRERLLACWDDTTAADHAYRCVLAHYLADQEDELSAEVAWDEKALEAYPRVADAELAEIGIPSTRGLAPSLHLNLGDGYRRQGRLDEARVQAALGLVTVGELGDDGYGRMVRQALARLADRLADPPGDQPTTAADDPGADPPGDRASDPLADPP